MKKSSEDQLLSSSVRPRFKVEMSLPIEDISKKIKDRLDEVNSDCIGTTSTKFISLRIPIPQQHYWSPQLSITISNENEKTIIRGVYGPRPAVWTMFVFFYTVIALSILAISVIGMSKLSLGDSSQIFWLVPILIGAFLSLYAVAAYGKKLGHDQMIQLKSFIEKSLEIKIHDQ